MARTQLTPVTVGWQDADVSANELDYTWTAADDVNGNAFAPTGKEILLARNTDVGAQTVTIPAADDAIGREGEITAYSIGAGEEARFGRFRPSDWAQNDGNVHVDASDAAVEFLLLKLS